MSLSIVYWNNKNHWHGKLSSLQSPDEPYSHMHTRIQTQEHGRDGLMCILSFTKECIL